ncbi:MAG: hypothetical protein JW914_04625 [Syntrophaceae bacterium]|nr:hypothetical protein [Syntrophaceae bacterium]
MKTTAVSLINVAAQKKMSQDELDKLYGTDGAGPIPNGDSAGATLVFPGTPLYDKVQSSTMVWGGKVFDCPNPEGPGTLINKFNGQLDFKAEVYYGISAHDGKKCIIVDYSKAPEFAMLKFRDEIRKVAEGLYLGGMYRQTESGGFEFMLNFTCDFNKVN